MTDTDAQTETTRDVRIEAARLKLELDKKLHRPTSELAQRLAAEKTSDERRAG
ncbi:hypothetical protein NJBCHELONAE_43380 [Mycobacteroides chelonae]|uniref:hypothetical protein n=1 Tax=Mycobacteroides chelonae TaxID=1774 RepID=UPI0021DC42AF|nr:hypothetical protein [Mycobacteroides chelonae]GLE59027.1 hypothetical protein NJBCHELONAE_43380 [Mycobacteroides chelonae]